MRPWHRQEGQLSGASGNKRAEATTEHHVGLAGQLQVQRTTSTVGVYAFRGSLQLVRGSSITTCTAPDRRLFYPGDKLSLPDAAQINSSLSNVYCLPKSGTEHSCPVELACLVSTHSTSSPTSMPSGGPDGENASANKDQTNCSSIGVMVGLKCPFLA